MTTAKELALKAFTDALKRTNIPKGDMPEHEIKERFENWWSEWYGRDEHKDSFYHKHNVYLDGKRYIQAE